MAGLEVALNKESTGVLIFRDDEAYFDALTAQETEDLAYDLLDKARELTIAERTRKRLASVAAAKTASEDNNRGGRA